LIVKNQRQRSQSRVYLSIGTHTVTWMRS